MRNVAPLVRDVAVDYRDALIVPVVLLRDVQIQLGQRVARYRLAFLRHFVCAQLELGELRLAEDGAFDVLQVVSQKRQPGVVILDVLEHVIDEQRLVEGGRHFRDEDRVVDERVGLRLVRKVALHRVTELVGDRAHVGILSAVVDQQVRMHVVRAWIHVPTGTLALGRKPVDPATVERVLDGGGILGAQRSHRRQHVPLSVFGAVLQVHGPDQRRIQVVVVQPVDAENLLSKLQVPMERRQRSVDAVDQARVHGRRNVRRVERQCEPRVVLPGPREEQHLLHLGVHRRSERAAVGTERGEERRHDLFAIGPIGEHAEIGVAGLIDLDRPPVAQRDRGIREIGVRENSVHFARAAGHRTRVGEELLFGFPERMGCAPSDVFEVETIDLQPRLGGQKALDSPFGKPQDLGLDERRLRAERRRQLHHLLLHALVLCVAGVFVREQARVGEEA